MIKTEQKVKFSMDSKVSKPHFSSAVKMSTISPMLWSELNKKLNFSVDS